MYYMIYEKETGNCLSCTNEINPKNTNPYIEISQEDFKAFNTHQKNLLDYYINALGSKQYLIKHEDEIKLDTVLSSYAIPKGQRAKDKVNIIQYKDKWALEIDVNNDELIYYIQSQPRLKTIFVTKDRDTNYLLDSFKLDLSVLNESGVIEANLETKGNVSILCARADDKYIHVENF